MGRFYIGSSINLSIRLSQYYSKSQLRKSKMIINIVLLKYGHSEFSLDILEYCNKKDITLREQYYFKLLNSKFNILKEAGFPLGFKHSKESRKKMNETKLGEKNYFFGKTHTE